MSKPKRFAQYALLAWLLVALAGILAPPVGRWLSTKSFEFNEEVRLQSGEVIQTRRGVIARPFGGLGAPSGWVNEGMTLRIISPVKSDNPGEWNFKFDPLLFDRDPDNQEWFVVATFSSCTSWYDLGRPKLPYTEFRFRGGQWVQQALSEKFIGRDANMLTDIRSSGEPNHTVESKTTQMADPRIDSTYKRVAAKWATNC